MSDLNLSLHAFQEGDPSGFTQIFQMYHEPLYSFVSKLVKNHEEAQDITSRTFEKLLKKHAEFKTHENIRALLYVAAKNDGLDYIRRVKRRKEMEAEISSLFSEIDSTKDLLISKEDLSMLYDKLQTLPLQPRLILKMSLMGFSNAEIAIHLKRPVQHINSQKSRGVRLLREIFLAHRADHAILPPSTSLPLEVPPGV